MIFLSGMELRRIHTRLIDLYGGTHGVRDEHLLDSALAQPSASFDGVYLHDGVVEMAAAYAYHLTGNHPFLDGNKRVALAAMLIFLELNGRSLRVGQEELYAAMMALSEGRLSKAALAAWLHERG